MGMLQVSNPPFSTMFKPTSDIDWSQASLGADVTPLPEDPCDAGLFDDGFSNRLGGGIAGSGSVGTGSVEELDAPSLIPSVNGSSHSGNSSDEFPDAVCSGPLFVERTPGTTSGPCFST